MRCPDCASPHLDAEGECERCHGVWLTEAAIVDRIHRELDLGPPALAELPCPVCATPMPTALLFGIEIDRCREHGVWFDKGEIDDVVRRAENGEWRLYGIDGAAPYGWPQKRWLTNLLDKLFGKKA
jgi:Zn-finger nucleic acid-binding protein